MYEFSVLVVDKLKSFLVVVVVFVSGLLETPVLPIQVIPETLSYKIFLTGKPGIGKTSTVAKLCGQGRNKYIV